MDLFERGLLVFFMVWLVASVWFVFGHEHSQRKLRALLARTGWFHGWRMYIPEVGPVKGSFRVHYRDQKVNGEIGEWATLESEPGWKPTLVIANPQLRITSIIKKTAKSFGRMKYHGRKPEEAIHYPLFLSLILHYQRPSDSYRRQVKVEQISRRGVVVVMQSDFLEGSQDGGY
jgi:hypothetical protein